MKELPINQIICGDCLGIMKEWPDDCIDLTVTSPPYDNIRDYHGYTFDYESVINELYRITKPGGVVVWVVGDATIDGSETLTSFKQALFAKEIGFNIHDTMIYHRQSAFPQNIRYWQDFEYMFVFSKGKPNTFNPIQEWKKTNTIRRNDNSTERNKDGTLSHRDEKAAKRILNASFKKTKDRGNVWNIDSGYMMSSKDKIAFKHPAIFPEQLAQDHILSWSNPDDVILDPMCGSGTTCKMAVLNGRKYIGIDISEEYCTIARKRVKHAERLPRRLIL